MIAGLHPHGRFQLSGHLPEEPYSIAEAAQEDFRNPSGGPFQPILLQFHYLFFYSFIKKTVWFKHSITLPDTIIYMTAMSYQEALHKVREGKSRHLRKSVKREREWRIP